MIKWNSTFKELICQVSKSKIVSWENFMIVKRNGKSDCSNTNFNVVRKFSDILKELSLIDGWVEFSNLVPILTAF